MASSDLDDFSLLGDDGAAVPLMLGGDCALLRGVGEFGKLAELEKLSSSLESDLHVDTDLAEPELTDPVPETKKKWLSQDQ